MATEVFLDQSLAKIKRLLRSASHIPGYGDVPACKGAKMQTFQTVAYALLRCYIAAPFITADAPPVRQHEDG